MTMPLYNRIGPRRSSVLMRRNEGVFPQDEPETVYLYPSLTTFPSSSTYPGTGA